MKLRCSYELNESNRDVLNYQVYKQFDNLTKFDKFDKLKMTKHQI